MTTATLNTRLLTQIALPIAEGYDHFRGWDNFDSAEQEAEPFTAGGTNSLDPDKNFSIEIKRSTATRSWIREVPLVSIAVTCPALAANFGDSLREQIFTALVKVGVPEAEIEYFSFKQTDAPNTISWTIWA